MWTHTNVICPAASIQNCFAKHTIEGLDVPTFRSVNDIAKITKIRLKHVERAKPIERLHRVVGIAYPTISIIPGGWSTLRENWDTCPSFSLFQLRLSSGQKSLKDGWSLSVFSMAKILLATLALTAFDAQSKNFSWICASDIGACGVPHW